MIPQCHLLLVLFPWQGDYSCISQIYVKSCTRKLSWGSISLGYFWYQWLFQSRSRQVWQWKRLLGRGVLKVKKAARVWKALGCPGLKEQKEKTVQKSTESCRSRKGDVWWKLKFLSKIATLRKALKQLCWDLNFFFHFIPHKLSCEVRGGILCN